MALPEILWLSHKFSTCEWSDFLSITIRLECQVSRLVLWKLEVWEGWIGINHGVLKLDHTSDCGMSKLNDLLEVRVSTKMQLISWVEWVKFGHKLLQVGLSIYTVVSLLVLADHSLRREYESTSSWVLKCLVQCINAIFLIKCHNRHTCLESTHLQRTMKRQMCCLPEQQGSQLSWFGQPKEEACLHESSRSPSDRKRTQKSISKVRSNFNQSLQSPTSNSLSVQLIFCALNLTASWYWFSATALL